MALRILANIFEGRRLITNRKKFQMSMLNNGNHWGELPVNKLRISMNS